MSFTMPGSLTKTAKRVQTGVTIAFSAFCILFAGGNRVESDPQPFFGDVSDLIQNRLSEDTQYFIFDVKGLLVAPAIEVKREISEGVISAMRINDRYIFFDRQNRGNLCSIDEGIARACIINLGIGRTPTDCVAGWQYSRTTNSTLLARINGTIIGCRVEVQRGSGLHAIGNALFHLDQDINYIGFVPEEETVSGWGPITGTARILSTAKIYVLDEDAFTLKICPTLTYSDFDKTYSLRRVINCEEYMIEIDDLNMKVDKLSSGKQSLNNLLQSAYQNEILQLVRHHLTWREQTDNETSPIWQFRNKGVYHLENDRRSIVVGEAFSRSNLDHFLGDVEAEVIETEYEDCTACYLVFLEGGRSIFVASDDGKSIRYIEAFGSAFTDDEGTRIGSNIAKGTGLFCFTNRMSGEQHCRRRYSSEINLIVEPDLFCEPPATVSMVDEIEWTTFNGCEFISGFSTGARW